ncbi:MAG: hypothetical protein U0R19_33760 [Bryobacteraceae bacterium]
MREEIDMSVSLYSDNQKGSPLLRNRLHRRSPPQTTDGCIGEAGTLFATRNKKSFDSAHGNLAASSGTISDTKLAAARLALRSQKGLDGKTPLDIANKFLVVPTASRKLGREVSGGHLPSAGRER